jgi:hypothetical protein
VYYTLLTLIREKPGSDLGERLMFFRGHCREVHVEEVRICPRELTATVAQ